MILTIVLFAYIYTRLRKTRIESFDDLMDLKWLFPSRRKRRPDYQTEIKPLLGIRSICRNKGTVSPWTSKPCECKGFKFKKNKRGVQYCECGCNMLSHPYHKIKKNKKDVDREDDD